MLRSADAPAAEQIASWGLPPGPLATELIDVVRTSRVGVWHTPDSYCLRSAGTSAQVPVLGSRFCRKCSPDPQPASQRYLNVLGDIDVVSQAAGQLDHTWRTIVQVESKTAVVDAARAQRDASEHPDEKHLVSASSLLAGALSQLHRALSVARAQAPDPVAVTTPGRVGEVFSGQQQNTLAEARRLCDIAAPRLRNDYSHGYDASAAKRLLLALSEAVEADPDTDLVATAVAAFDGARVTDVAGLPSPAVTSSHGHVDAASWAAVELRVLVGRTAERWLERLQQGRRDVEAGTSSVLLRVTSWPRAAVGVPSCTGTST